MSCVGSSPGVDGRRRFALLSVLGGTCLAAGGVYVVTGHGVPCPFLTMTGLLCPICGSSRMGAALLRGDLPAAWGWNPFVLVLGVLFAFVWVWTGLALFRRRPVGLPGLLAVLDRLSPLGLVALIGVPALVFAVLRNLF